MADVTPGNSKAIAAGTSGALAVVLCWAAETFGHVVIPAEVGIALATVMSSAAVYFTPHAVGSSPR